ncbi:unnamed protein product [Sphagnum balticum]
MVRLRFNDPTNGSIYVRHNYDTCRQTFVDAYDTTLMIPLRPSSDRPQFSAGCIGEVVANDIGDVGGSNNNGEGIASGGEDNLGDALDGSNNNVDGPVDRRTRLGDIG